MPIEFRADAVTAAVRAAARPVAARVHGELLDAIARPGIPDLGWMNIREWASEGQMVKIHKLADRARAESEVLLVVGVGGSNQAARAVIEALKPQLDGPEVRWAGTNLSADYHTRLFAGLRGRQVHFVIIAKNFETLEPGLVFRICREFAHREYGNDYARHFTVIGTAGSLLQELAIAEGMAFLEFPTNVGGRFTALTSVGTFPMAVAGVDVDSLIRGGVEQQQEALGDNVTVLEYAAARAQWFFGGSHIEGLAFFEPALARFGAWWVQLFAESEGKEGRGLFPVALSYSEQLHSVGQYVQEGQRIVAETFLDITKPSSDFQVPATDLADRFDYITGASVNWINRTAFEATLRAHTQDGVPTGLLKVPQLDAATLGQLFYFFSYAVALSGRMLDVYPFDQPGVEAYKAIMFEALGRPF